MIISSRFLVSIFILIISLQVVQAQKTDSLYSYLDTLDDERNHHIGFVLGGGLLMPIIKPNAKALTYTDFNSKSTFFGTVGISGLFPVRKNALETAILLNINRIDLDYTYLNQKYNDTIHHSLLMTPLLFSTLDTNSRSKGYFAFGLIPTFDISKKPDKTSRVFPMIFSNIGLTAKAGWRLKSYTSIYDFALVFTWFPINYLRQNGSEAIQDLNYLSFFITGIQCTIR
ncbi:MAG: hypothetical protein JXR34_03465 [Bacteroidales bacterium]|nr:hypothetical protein [Bacteroidales bacterium]